MTIAVAANDAQWKLLTNNLPDIVWSRMEKDQPLPVGTTAVVILDEVEKGFVFPEIPVLLNAVTTTLKDVEAPSNVIRINGWNTFLERTTWEVVGTITDEIKTILKALNKAYHVVPDEPGFIAARIIAMIINEAWFALGENVSSKDDINIAMKLGTNYPYGPFEWCDLIGTKNIYELLQQLSLTDDRYTPAPLLKQAATT